MMSKSRKKLISVVAVILTVGLIAAFYIYRAQSANTYETVTPNAAQASGAPTAPIEGAPDTAKTTFYLDGWSKVTTDGVSVTYTPEVKDANPVPITWTPLSSDEISTLATDNADIVERYAARLGVTGSDLTCNADGCTSSTGDLSYDQIADPKTIPGFEEIYESQKVTAGIWKYDLNVSPEVAAVVLSATEWNNTTVNLLTAGAETTEIFEDESETFTVEPEANNGYLKGQFPLSAAFGSFFTTTPTWIVDEPVSQYRRDTNGTEVTPEQVIEKLAEPAFAKGLSSPTIFASQLTPSQLTYMSSPATGCGVGVLCSPGTFETTFADSNVTAIEVCNINDGQNAILSVENSNWTFDLGEKKTTMFGAWNGTNPDAFENKQGESVIYTGTAPVITGSQTVHQNTARLFDGRNGEVILFANAGQMAQAGFDSEEALNRQLTTDAYPDLFNGDYAPCGA